MTEQEATDIQLKMSREMVNYGWKMWKITPNLRWNNGVLEQLWQEETCGDQEWKPIPQPDETL